MEKPTMNLEIEQLFTTQFSVFRNYEKDARVEQIEKVMYIQDIAGKLNKDIKGINLFSLFSNNNNVILADKAEINKTLATFKREEFIQEEKKEIELLSVEQIANIDRVMIGLLEDNKAQHDRDINNTIRQASRYSQAYTKELSSLNRLRQEKNALQKQSPAYIIDGVNKLLQTGKYSLREITSSGNIDLLINDDIILTQKNAAAGIDLRVNLGEMRMFLEISNGNLSCYVLRHYNNTEVNEFYHPHVDENGDVCFGNMSSVYTDAVNNSDLFAMVETVYKVLTNYNHENPYRTLSEFCEESRQIQSNGKTHEEPERRQEHACFSCDHDFEVTFGPSSASNYTEDECPECGDYHEYGWYE